MSTDPSSESSKPQIEITKKDVSPKPSRIDQIKARFGGKSPREILEITVPQNTLEIKPEELVKNPPEIVISSQDVSEKSAIEIKPEEVGSQSTPQEDITIEMDTTTHTFQEQQDIANRQVQKEVEEIKLEYAGKRVDTPIHLETHHVQEAQGQNGEWGCVPSSVLNALNALDINPTAETERSITEAMGGNRANGLIGEQQALDYMRSKGLSADSDPSFMAMVKNLQENGVGIISTQAHARLISGMEVATDGRILLRMNDPLNPDGVMQKIPLDTVAQSYIREAPTARGIINIQRPLSAQQDRA